MDERAISFGSFRLLPSQRLLLEGDQPVRLGSRALDILAVLAENAGRVVPKEELIASVWPKVFVEESNLKIQVSALRRALGDGQGGNRYIVTVPGRGYEFVVPVGLTAEPAVNKKPLTEPGAPAGGVSDTETWRVNDGQVRSFAAKDRVRQSGSCRRRCAQAARGSAAGWRVR